MGHVRLGLRGVEFWYKGLSGFLIYFEAQCQEVLGWVSEPMRILDFVLKIILVEKQLIAEFRNGLSKIVLVAKVCSH